MRDNDCTSTIIVYILLGRMGIDRVTGVSNHLIKESVGHSGFDCSSRFHLHFLRHVAARSCVSVSLTYTMYDSSHFVLRQRFSCLESCLSRRSNEKISRSFSQIETWTAPTEEW